VAFDHDSVSNEGRWDITPVPGWRDKAQKKERTPEMRYIDYGLGILAAKALAPWPDGKAFDLADVYGDLVSRNELAGFEVEQRFYEIGSPEGLAELDAMLRSQQLSVTS
jgi:NDP-sugar pyrophosphorylase family protein